MKSKFIPQLKIADMFSMGGTGLLGLGLGAALNSQLTGIIPVLILVGLIIHALGMYGRYEIEHEHIDPPSWVIITFVACWMGLMIAGLYILIARYVVVVL